METCAMPGFTFSKCVTIPWFYVWTRMSQAHSVGTGVSNQIMSGCSFTKDLLHQYGTCDTALMHSNQAIEHLLGSYRQSNSCMRVVGDHLTNIKQHGNGLDCWFLWITPTLRVMQPSGCNWRCCLQLPFSIDKCKHSMSEADFSYLW